MSELSELKQDINRNFENLRSDIKDLIAKIDKHVGEDAEFQGTVAAELGIVRNKLEGVDDRNKFVRNWIAGLLAMAVAAVVGFVIRNSIQVEVARPVTLPAPQSPASSATR